MRRKAPAPESIKTGVAKPGVAIPGGGLGRCRIGILRAEFNSKLTESLEKSCLEELARAGVPAGRIDRFTVPGCFEIPWLAQRLVKRRGGTQRYDVLIALAVVIRGDTKHFDMVSTECARGVMEIMLKHGVPIVFEVLAAYNRRDAVRRASQNQYNKGLEAAHAALFLLKILKKSR